MSRCFFVFLWLANLKVVHLQSPSEIPPQLFGIKIAGEGAVKVPAEKEAGLLFFGLKLNSSRIRFTRTSRPRGSDCTTIDSTQVYTPLHVSDGITRVDVNLATSSNNYFVCLEGENSNKWLHQGNESYLQIVTKIPFLPLWGNIFMILTLLTFSGLFSGLNLGLMSLDKNDLQVIARCGTEEEKRFARTIAPVRKRGNYLLCSILLGNVFVNSTLTIFMDELTSGLIAIITSTLAIVIFGEIMPQAACSRHGLAVGAKTIYLTYAFMILTFPLSYPISKMLDYVLGDEIGHVYDRERLMEYIKVTKTYNKLEEDEVNIIAGALNLKNKTVGEIMTRLEDVFMLAITATLDFNTVSEISKRGYSRVPVYDGDRKNIVALLHAKDLAFVDPDDNKPLRTHVEFYRHQLVHTYEDESLFNLLNDLRLGKSHMAFVRKIYATEDEDPYYEITGVVTLEDIIEEILQMEIVDETDTLIDNRKKQRRKGAEQQDFTDFARIGAAQQGTHHISSQLAFATFQYLSTMVEPFKKPLITEAVLRRLIAQKIYFFVKNIKDDDANSLRERTLYVAGKPVDYFIMILEGKALVTVGSENLVFDAGPFTYFGTAALRLTNNDVKNAARPPTPDSPKGTGSTGSIGRTSSTADATSLVQVDTVTFKPDYSVKIVESTLYMKVTRTAYLAAYRASMMEMQKHFSQDEDRLAKEIDSVFKTSLASGEQRHSISMQQLQTQTTQPKSERARAKVSSTSSLSPLVKRRESPTNSQPCIPLTQTRRSSAASVKPPAPTVPRRTSPSPPGVKPLRPPSDLGPLKKNESSFSSSKMISTTRSSSPLQNLRKESDSDSKGSATPPPSSPREDSHLIGKRRK